MCVVSSQAVYESHEERARKHKDLTEWEHVEVDNRDGATTLRTVKSTAPKGLVFHEERMESEAENQRMEERRKLREQLGLDKEIEGEFVIV